MKSRNSNLMEFSLPYIDLDILRQRYLGEDNIVITSDDDENKPKPKPKKTYQQKKDERSPEEQRAFLDRQKGYVRRSQGRKMAAQYGQDYDKDLHDQEGTRGYRKILKDLASASSTATGDETNQVQQKVSLPKLQQQKVTSDDSSKNANIDLPIPRKRATQIPDRVQELVDSGVMTQRQAVQFLGSQKRNFSGDKEDFNDYLHGAAIPRLYKRLGQEVSPQEIKPFPRKNAVQLPDRVQELVDSGVMTRIQALKFMSDQKTKFTGNKEDLNDHIRNKAIPRLLQRYGQEVPQDQKANLIGKNVAQLPDSVQELVDSGVMTRKQALRFMDNQRTRFTGTEEEFNDHIRNKAIPRLLQRYGQEVPQDQKANLKRKDYVQLPDRVQELVDSGDMTRRQAVQFLGGQKRNFSGTEEEFKDYLHGIAIPRLYKKLGREISQEQMKNIKRKRKYTVQLPDKLQDLVDMGVMTRKQAIKYRHNQRALYKGDEEDFKNHFRDKSIPRLYIKLGREMPQDQITSTSTPLGDIGNERAYTDALDGRSLKVKSKNKIADKIRNSEGFLLLKPEGFDKWPSKKRESYRDDVYNKLLDAEFRKGTEIDDRIRNTISRKVDKAFFSIKPKVKKPTKTSKKKTTTTAGTTTPTPKKSTTPEPQREKYHDLSKRIDDAENNPVELNRLEREIIQSKLSDKDKRDLLLDIEYFRNPAGAAGVSESRKIMKRKNSNLMEFSLPPHISLNKLRRKYLGEAKGKDKGKGLEGSLPPVRTSTQKPFLQDPNQKEKTTQQTKTDNQAEMKRGRKALQANKERESEYRRAAGIPEPEGVPSGFGSKIKKSAADTIKQAHKTKLSELDEGIDRTFEIFDLPKVNLSEVKNEFTQKPGYANQHLPNPAPGSVFSDQGEQVFDTTQNVKDELGDSSEEELSQQSNMNQFDQAASEPTYDSTGKKITTIVPIRHKI